MEGSKKVLEKRDLNNLLSGVLANVIFKICNVVISEDTFFQVCAYVWGVLVSAQRNAFIVGVRFDLFDGFKLYCLYQITNPHVWSY